MPETTTRKEYTEEELEAAISIACERHLYEREVTPKLTEVTVLEGFKILPTGQTIEAGGSYTYEFFTWLPDDEDDDAPIKEWDVFQYSLVNPPANAGIIDGPIWTAKPLTTVGNIIMTKRDFQVYAAQYDADRVGNYGLSLALAALTLPGVESESAERLEVTLYGGKLDKLAANRSFAYKALKGLETIPYKTAEEGFKEVVRRGDQVAEFTAHPDKCAAFIRHKDANSHLAGRLLATIGRLLSLPNAKEHMSGGRIWITTKRIIEELGSKSLARSAEYRQTIIDCLEALSSAQITYRGPDGKLIYSGYLLPVEYREEVFDKQGNSIKDAWGFYPGGEALRFYKAMEGGNVTTELPGLEAGKLNATESWLVDFLKANVLSELRAALYPKRGKAPKTCERQRNLSELFKAYHIPSDGNITSRAKDRIVCDLETVLKSLALEEAQNGKPIYIEATTTKAGRSWDKLIVKGSKAYKKDLPKVDLGATKYTPKPKKSKS